MNIPPFIGMSDANDSQPFYDFVNIMDDARHSGRTIFDPELFRAMLDDPAQRASFAARHPTAKAMFEEYLEATRRTFPEFPRDGITALQLTLFDNGEPKPRQSKAKRPRERVEPLMMASRFGLTAKVWDRLDVNWTKKHHIAWEANAFMWSVTDALIITQKLSENGRITPATAGVLREFAKVADHDVLFSIFSQREPGLGSKWTDVVACVVLENGFPSRALLLLSAENGYVAESFDTCTARGQPLGGNAIAQARLPLCEKFERWGTEPVRIG